MARYSKHVHIYGQIFIARKHVWLDISVRPLADLFLRNLSKYFEEIRFREFHEN